MPLDASPCPGVSIRSPGTDDEAMALPPYTRRKLLKSGAVGWFWEPPTWARKAGCPVHAEALGPDYLAAKERVDGLLYPAFRAWRLKRKAPKSLDSGARLGTVDWLFETAQRCRRWQKASERARGDYRKRLNELADVKVKGGGRLGHCHVATVTPAITDDAYGRLLKGGKRKTGKRYRTANLAFDIARYAWKEARRLHPKIVPTDNPFAGVTRERLTTDKPAATYQELCDLVEASSFKNHFALAVAAQICFWWHQRPENVLDGYITWGDYRPPDRPNEVRVFHHKTGREQLAYLGGQRGPVLPRAGRLASDRAEARDAHCVERQQARPRSPLRPLLRPSPSARGSPAGKATRARHLGCLPPRRLDLLWRRRG
jgi:hypothetical protein